jgi:hypothetical protein
MKSQILHYLLKLYDISGIGVMNFLIIFYLPSVHKQRAAANSCTEVEFFTVFYGLELLLNPLIFERQNASGRLSF